MTTKTKKQRKRKHKDSELPTPPKIPKGLKLNYFEPDFEFYKSLLSGDTDNKTFRKKTNELKSDLIKLLQLMKERYDVEKNISEMEQVLKELDKDIEIAHDVLINKYS